MKTTQKSQKNTKFPQKNKNPSWGLTLTPTSEFFSDFWIFFNLTKPLSCEKRLRPKAEAFSTAKNGELRGF